MGRRIFLLTSALLMLSLEWLPSPSRAQSTNLLARVDTCSIPEVPTDAELVFLGMFKARAIATIDLASRGVTGVADVMIEPGNKPIYLIAASTGGMILRFSGHVERLTNVVSVAWFGMGFVGIDKDRAAWREGSECGIRSWDPDAIGFFGPNERKWGTAAEQIQYVEALAKRPIDRKVVEGSFGLVALPTGQLLKRDQISGQMRLNVEGGDGFVGEDLLRRYPDGLIEVQPEEVIYSEPVRRLTSVRISKP